MKKIMPYKSKVSSYLTTGSVNKANVLIQNINENSDSDISKLSYTNPKNICNTNVSVPDIIKKSTPVAPAQKSDQCKPSAVDVGKKFMKECKLLMRVTELCNFHNIDRGFDFLANNSALDRTIFELIEIEKGHSKTQNIGRSCSLIMEHASIHPFEGCGDDPCGILIVEPNIIEAAGIGDLDSYREGEKLFYKTSSATSTLKDIAKTYKNSIFEADVNTSSQFKAHIDSKSQLNEVVTVIERKDILGIFVREDFNKGVSPTHILKAVAAQRCLIEKYNYFLPIIAYCTNDELGTSTLSPISDLSLKKFRLDPLVKQICPRDKIGQLISSIKDVSCPSVFDLTSSGAFGNS